MSKQDDTKKRKKRTKAQRADKHALYLASVQEPSVEVDFIAARFRKYFGRPARVLREDFCGSAAVCYEWVRGRAGKERRAIGVDIDPEPLDWGRRHIAAKMHNGAVDRVTLLQEDVRHVADDKADVIAAQNFSFWVFKTRPALLEYFRAAYANLGEQGLFVLDMMGGSEAFIEDHEEKSKRKGFTYVWEQVRFNPITHDCKFHIHFRFKDGSQIRRAFTYEWRLWSIPEVRELLLEAGFRAADVYWEGSDKHGDGDGVFRNTENGSADPAWIAYVVGVK